MTVEWAVPGSGPAYVFVQLPSAAPDGVPYRRHVPGVPIIGGSDNTVIFIRQRRQYSMSFLPKEEPGIRSLSGKPSLKRYAPSEGVSF